MKVAIIGTGISGLTSAYRLAPHCDVSVFESADQIGGHTATKDVQINGQHYAIDTGFIVFNECTYPNFIALMDELGVVSRPTPMSFSVSCDSTGLEYSGTNLNTLFCQRKNLLRPYFLRLLADILRFNRHSVADLEAGKLPADMTLGEYLRINGYSEGFRQHYLIPMGSAIWSSGLAEMEHFPLLFFVQFFHNHGLLQIRQRPQWRTIEGGSRSYLKPLTASFSDRIRLSTSITEIRRSEDAVWLLVDGQHERFDHVVLACHSDQALQLLTDATSSEHQVLGSIAYQKNDVVLHTDERLLPQRRLAWSSWNYKLNDRARQLPVLTYNMNILQGIAADTTFCVTLNDSDSIDPHKILGRYQYAHPVFSQAAITAQQRWAEINGDGRTWYAGAYWANGFHEDGVNSGNRVAEHLLAQVKQSVKAEVMI